MREHTFRCSTLPEIDAVEILLVDPDYELVPRRPSIPGATLARLSDEPAQQVARLWRALPSGEQSRCHMPRYGVRFLREGALLLEAALCFECDNISVIALGQHDWAVFNGSAPASRELLALFRSHDPASGARS